MSDVRYYAVPDPDQPSVMTYWKQDGELLLPWPRRARYGPQVQAPRGAYRAMAAQMDVRNTWMDKIRDEIARNGDEASARFAVNTVRCEICGTKLTDPLSQAIGLGPDCRAGMAADVIDRFKAEISRHRNPEETQ